MKKFIALVVMLCAVLVSSTASAAADWVWIYSDDEFTIYVDNSSIRRDDNYRGYVFRAFVKTNYSDAGRNRAIEGWRSFGKPLPKGIYNLSHTVELFLFKEENTIKYCDIISHIAYTPDGNTIPEMTFFSKDSIQWGIISPDTFSEIIFDAVRARVPN